MKRISFGCVILLLTLSTFSSVGQSLSDYSKLQIAQKLRTYEELELSQETVDSIFRQVQLFFKESPEEYKAFYLHCLSSYFGQRDFKEGLKYSRQAILYVELLTDSLKEANVPFAIYRRFGRLNYRLDELDSMKWGCEKALQLADVSKHSTEVIGLYFDLSDFSIHSYNNLSLGKEYLDRGYQLMMEHIQYDHPLKTRYFFILAKYFFNLQEYDSSSYYFVLTLNRTSDPQNKERVYYQNKVYSYLANINFDTENYVDALKYDLLSMRSETDSIDLIASYNNVGQDYLLINKPDSTLYYYRKALDLSEVMKSPSRKVEVLDNLTEFYEKNSQFEKAYTYQKESKNISDTLNRYRTNQRYNQLLREYEAEKQEKEIKEQQDQINLLSAREELANLRTTIIVGVVLIILISGFLVSRSRIKQKEQKAQQLKEIGEFKEAMTGMIAHDLKNPLSLILNSSAEQESTQYSARQMLQLINNLLDVQKFESADVKLEKTHFSLHELVTHIGGLLTPLLNEKNIKLEIKVDDTTAVSADREMTERILINLLTNAIKFSPLNGVIGVVAKVENEKIQISVSDQGPGIAKEKVDDIFESFRQVEARNSGGVASTGLGLTFCRLAIKAHGSDIQVRSKEGEGTTFTFQLEEGKGEMVDIKKQLEEELVFSITDAERANILNKIPALKSMKLYEVGEIKETLMDIKQHLNDQQAIDQWVESVLDAAYAGNEEEYARLLEDF